VNRLISSNTSINIVLKTFMYIYKIKFALEQDTKAQMRSGVYLHSFFNLGARCGRVGNATPRPPYLRERPGTCCIDGWVGYTVGLDGEGKSRPPFRNTIPGSFSP
jgi:hypothetical protein